MDRHNVWVGLFESHDQTIDYFRYDYRASDDEPVSQFASDQGANWYDIDWFIINYLDTPAELERSLESFAYQGEVVAATSTHENLVPTVWVALPVSEVANPTSISAPGINLLYLGAFDAVAKIEPSNDPLDAFSLGATRLNLGGRRTPMELGHMSDRIGLFENMRSLRIGQTDLRSIPPAIGRARALEELHINRNPIATLPDELGDLATLRVINMSDVGMTEVPLAISKLHNLETLVISRSKIASLPAEICTLPKLTAIDLSGNELTTLPQDWSAMLELETLNVEHNKLSTLPSGLADLPKLTSINALANPIEQLPPELVDHPRIHLLR